MKSLSLTCFLSVCIMSATSLSHAQSVLPLAVENATWILFHHDEFWGLDSYRALKVNGDTILNNITYKRVYGFALSRTGNNEYYQISEPVLKALMRDDSLDARVYAVFVGTVDETDSCTIVQEEVLLYDFALTVGDTITDCRSAGNIDPIVIDTIYKNELYGTERRIWVSGSFEVLIEGVGYSLGLFTEGSGIITDDHFTTLVDYCIGTNFECGLYTSTFTPGRDQNAIIYPNPVQDLLTIHTVHHFSNAVIYTAMGQFIEKVKLTEDQILQLSEYLPGVYFLVVQDETGESATVRFVKN